MIRNYLPSDKNSFSRLYIESNIKGQAYLSPEFWQADCQEVVNQYFPQATTFLYEDKNKVVGTISLIENEIGGLFVSPSQWGQGIGSALIDDVKTHHSTLHLKVFTKNHRALSFYQKNGFEIRQNGICQVTGLAEYDMFWAAT